MVSDSVLGLITARGGSKGIPGKNIKKLHGRPLIEYSIEAALKCDAIDRTVVTTDDSEIATVAMNAGADVPFTRPAELAEDETPTEPVVTHALTELSDSYDAFVLLQPTSPLRTATHVGEAVTKYHSTGATSLVGVYEDHSYRWQETNTGAVQINYGGNRKRRQEKESEYVENGAIYMTDVDAFLETEEFTTGRTELYEMNVLDSIDIDEPVDMRLAELLMTE